MINRLTDALKFQTEALVLRSERQRLLASNIANADTPGYQARDFDFKAALGAATAGLSGAGGWSIGAGLRRAPRGATGLAGRVAGADARSRHGDCDRLGPDWRARDRAA